MQLRRRPVQAPPRVERPPRLVVGDVLGVINMVLVKGTRESILSQPSGITYAVPSKYIQDLVEKGR